MTRNLKALGLALVAVFAISAVAASTASATEFHSEVTPTTLTGSQIGTDVITFTAGTWSCTEHTFKGSFTGLTSTTASVSPSYSGCTAFGFPGTVIDVNGCENIFHTQASGNAGTMDIECPDAPMTITAKVLGQPKCTITIDDQTGLKGVTFSNEGAGSSRDLKVTFSINEELKYTEHAGSGLAAYSSGTSTTGSYTGSATFKGENALSEQKGIWVE